MRLFLSDLDKTLLRSDLSLSEFTKEVWNSFAKPLSIATARSYTGAMKLLDGLRLDAPMILLDGVMIANPDGSIIRLNALDKAITDEIIAIVQKEFDELPLIVGYEKDREHFLYPNKLNPHQKELLQNYKNDKRVLGIKNLQGLEKNLKIVYLGDKEKMQDIEQRVKALFDVESKLAKDPYQDCYFLTFLHPLGDKAHALQELEEIMGISPKEVTVFGDSLNDIGMFRQSGKAIAVANALPEVKEAADIVLEWSNDEDAVARYLASV